MAANNNENVNVSLSWSDEKNWSVNRECQEVVKMMRKHPELISELTLMVFSSHFFNEFEELLRLRKIARTQKRFKYFERLLLRRIKQSVNKWRRFSAAAMLFIRCNSSREGNLLEIVLRVCESSQTRSEWSSATSGKRPLQYHIYLIPYKEKTMTMHGWM